MHGKLDQKQTTTMLYAYQIAMSAVNRPDGMAPCALEQLERRQVEQANARKRSSSRAPLDDEDDDEPSFTETLIQDLERISGKTLDLEGKNYPPGQRPSEEQIMLDALKSITSPSKPQPGPHSSS